MLIKEIPLDNDLVSNRNIRVDELKIQYPESAECFEKMRIQTPDDVVIPYGKWLSQLHSHEDTINMRFIEDNKDITWFPVFVSQLNWNHDFDAVSTLKTTKTYEFYSCMCDNASQAMMWYRKLLKRGAIFTERKYILVLVPFFKDLQPKQGGWRWCKWGEYIGVQKQMCEYLYDEPHIDMVYSASLYEVIEKEGIYDEAKTS